MSTEAQEMQGLQASQQTFRTDTNIGHGWTREWRSARVQPKYRRGEMAMSENLLIQSLGLPSGMAGWQFVSNKPITTFTQFTNDPVLKSNIAYFMANIGKATTASQFLADPRLQQVVLTAYGLSQQIGANGLMQKVLTSKLSDPTSVANTLVSQGYKQITSALGYGNASTQAVAATASSASVSVDGLDGGAGSFGTFSGTFGGITLQNVDLSAATTPAAIAQTLTNAFQQASGGKSTVAVSTVGFTLKFTDSAGNGTASGFSWTPNAASPTTATAGTPTNLVAGNPAVAATGGPNVTSSSFVNTVVQKYQQAMFDNLVGNTSPILSNALYAQQNLPNIKNWYSVIADTKLATVVETTLGLPSSFMRLDVDQQNTILSQKMNISDLQNPTKLSNLLNKYVAIATAQATQDDDGAGGAGSSSPALQILAGSLSTPSSGNGSIMSSGSIAALLRG
jgi:hypothetical protein